jgi:hypothetical protein
MRNLIYAAAATGEGDVLVSWTRVKPGTAQYEGYARTMNRTGAKGSMEVRLASEIAQRKIGYHVKRLGYVPSADLDALYHEAVAMTFPSRFEGFGAPVLEAMAPYVVPDEIEVPQPGEGQVLIKVRLASVNPSDVMFVKGLYGQPRRTLTSNCPSRGMGGVISPAST